MGAMRIQTGWGIKWEQDNALEGHREFLMGCPERFYFFRTRREARAFRDEEYGYIKNSETLQKEPHGWKFPKVVKVRLTMEEV